MKRKIRNVKLCSVVLAVNYRQKCSERSPYGSSPKVVEKDTVRVARYLEGDPALAELYLDTIFDSWPKDRCKEIFGTPWPPIAVTFGTHAIERYEREIKCKAR